jgi:hypothetical protein
MEEVAFAFLVFKHCSLSSCVGSIAGNVDMDDFYLRIISVEFRLSIVNVDYRFAFPHQRRLQVNPPS